MGVIFILRWARWNLGKERRITFRIWLLWVPVKNTVHGLWRRPKTQPGEIESLIGDQKRSEKEAEVGPRFRQNYGRMRALALAYAAVCYRKGMDIDKAVCR